MAEVKFSSYADFCKIVEHKIPESLTLEYKDADILKNINKITKAISAFANSVGGNFLIGIKSKNNIPVDAADGWHGESKYDWLYQIIDSNISPKIEGIRIQEFKDESSRLYYSVHVPRSPLAPHQNGDKVYYKRKGSHSISMEHYEIEDVRNRPKSPNMPLVIGIDIDQSVALLKLENIEQTKEVRNMKFIFEGNFDIPKEYFKRISTRGLNILKPREEKRYMIGSFFDILNKNSDPYLKVSVDYEFQSTQIHDSQEFFFADFSDNVIMERREIKALENLVKKIEALDKATKMIGEAIYDMSHRFSDGTGLRMSAREKTHSPHRRKYSPREFGSSGYQILLGISSNHANELDFIFNRLLSTNQGKSRYDRIPQEVREKFESQFEVVWLEGQS